MNQFQHEGVDKRLTDLEQLLRSQSGVVQGLQQENAELKDHILIIDNSLSKLTQDFWESKKQAAEVSSGPHLSPGTLFSLVVSSRQVHIRCRVQ